MVVMGGQCVQSITLLSGYFNCLRLFIYCYHGDGSDGVQYHGHTFIRCYVGNGVLR